MWRTDKKKREEIGLSPFDLVFRGRKKIDKVQLKAISYSVESLNELEVNTPEQLKELRDGKNAVWLNIYGLDNVNLMKYIGETFSVNNMILSDVMNPSLRPRLQEIDDCLFFNVKLFGKDLAGIDNLSLIITKNALITFQEKPGNYFNPIRERLQIKSKIRKSGPDYLAFAILDVVVDSYIFRLGELGERIEALEDETVGEYPDEFIEKVTTLKRELNLIRKIVKPVREMIHALAKIDNELIRDSNKVHYKELVDNINEANDLTENYREILYDMLNMYHTNVSSKLNETMQLLTIISVIFIPITFIAGIYGTNFDFLPELHFKWGYFAMLGLMAVIAGAMLWYFKRRKWF